MNHGADDRQQTAEARPADKHGFLNKRKTKGTKGEIQWPFLVNLVRLLFEIFNREGTIYHD